MQTVDPIVEADLQGYLDDQLPLERRIAVEAHLAARPDLAARVMTDMRLRDELKLALMQPAGQPRPRTTQAARRLERGLRWRRHSGALRRAAAIGLFLMAGWFAHAQFGTLGIGAVSASGLPPAFVEEAVDAGLLQPTRLGNASRTPAYEPDRILAETAIALPVLPDDWQVEDVVVAPSRFGPSVAVSIRAPDVGRLSLIAIRPGVFDVVPVTLAHGNDTTVAHWQIGDVAYALVAQGAAGDIDRLADGLVRTLY
ncbi:anti-sigma factor RsiW [Pseudochelatococcus lubricantis]|uniref:Anti-sigma factor RsiW n=1 Tax=Pseudochelatococcus lubricantis TaxID=1538102 RepID=A0ABX0UZT5_9HYPH|nr:anti-sigma factor [Pseudochelatococcus lubricantis]NIJ58472.1 anti-sigma factor RsiW [Pseudochelatococcus lubricantis]